MILSVLAWYLIASTIGWLAFPLAFRLLPALSDRGYAFSRSLGLLLWGYIFWLLGSLGLLKNDLPGLLLSLALLVLLSAWMLRRGGVRQIAGWLRDHRAYALTVELLFLAAFFGWAFVRAANPEAMGTEKPMELAFINAILRSESLPPHDPWLSGYAISYYYFGYILVAMLAKLAGTSGAVAFNLGGVLVFALSALGAYGLVYNLLAQHQKSKANEPDRRSLAPSLLGPLFVLFVSNLEGLLQVLHTRGLFWRQDASGLWSSPFWRWLDILDLNQPPAQPFSWIPTRFWWWWRASRVVQDYDLVGNPKEIIDEFPAFSYLLSDLHPHVLSMPFVFLAMALALNVFFGGARRTKPLRPLTASLQSISWIAVLALLAGVTGVWKGLSELSVRWAALGLVSLILASTLFVRYNLSLRPRRADTPQAPSESVIILFPLSLNIPTLVAAWVVLGGLAFLNTWDFPFQVALFAAAEVMRRAFGRAWGWWALKEITLNGLLIGLGGILVYLPFYAGFSSQAGGLLPNLIYPTRGAHLWVMFAPLLIPIGALLVYLLRRRSKVEESGARFSFLRALSFSLGLAALAWALTLLLGYAITRLPELGYLFKSTLSAEDTPALLKEAILRRFIQPGAWITLTLLLAGLLALLIPSGRRRTLSPANTFALLLILLGLGLVFLPEFFFLRDQFGWRMNTIFKFYFQAWLIWGVAAAYAVAWLSHRLHNAWGTIFRISMALLIGMGLVYPLLSLPSKTNNFHPADGFTLDSTAYLRRANPDELSAVDWLKTAPMGVVAEAVGPGGGSYTGYARISMLTGLPAVLGWTGHESQWRGGAQEMGTRSADIERLYCSRDWNEAQEIIERYDIRYIFVGGLERSTYQPNAGSCPSGMNEMKFERFLTPVFQSGQAVIYEAPSTQRVNTAIQP